MGNLKNIVGLTFGRLTVLTQTGIFCSCRCTCGTIKTYYSMPVKNGKTSSCGCLQRELFIAKHSTHGDTGTPEYEAWKSILKRCYSDSSPNFRLYGGRGITMCEEWRSSYPAFLAYIGRRPSPKHSVDRWPDNNGNYEPGNVRWATPVQQARNKRTTIILFDGSEALPLVEWADRIGVSPETLRSRRRKLLTNDLQILATSEKENSTMLRVTELQVENIKGVRSVRFALGTITILRGRNASGKSSVLDAVRSIFEGGLDPQHLRNGADRGYVSMKLSDGSLITKTIRHKRNGELVAELEITDPQGVVIPAPKTFVEGLSDAMSVDPAQILRFDTSTADGRKKFVQLLLQLLPVAFSPAEIISTCTVAGECVLTGSERPQKPLTLEDLRRVRGVVEEGRRRIGIEAEQAAGAVASLQRSLPTDDGTDWQARVTECQEALRAADAELASAQTGVRESAVQQERDATKEIDAKIADLHAQILALQEDKRQKVADINRRKLQSLDSNEQIAKPELDRMKNDLAIARERATMQAKAAGVRESIAGFEAQAQAGKQRYEGYSGVLMAIDELRKSKLDNLPVAGLEFEGDQVTYLGVPWSQVNTAGKVTVAVALSAEKSKGALGFQIIDDLEHLDTSTATELEGALREAGFQVLGAAVDDDARPTEGQPFLIETT